jgi:hypothetical protein
LLAIIIATLKINFRCKRDLNFKFSIITSVDTFGIILKSRVFFLIKIYQFKKQKFKLLKIKRIWKNASKNGINIK